MKALAARLLRSAALAALALHLDLSASMMLPGIGAAAIGATALASLLYITTLTDTVDATIFTFTSANLGTVDTNRTVIACVGWNSTTTLSSVVINGVTATIISASQQSLTSAAIVMASVPTGSTGNIVVTFSGSTNRVAVSTYYSLLPGLVVMDYDAPTTVTASAITASDLRVTATGFVIGCCMNNDTSAFTTTWGGSEAVVEDYDATQEATSRWTSCSFLTTAAGTTSDLTFTAGGSIKKAAIAVSFSSVYTPIIREYFYTKVSTVANATQTYSNMPIGVANASRMVVAAVGWDNNSPAKTISAFTIGGVAATQAAYSGSTNNGVAIYWAVVPTGVLADVVMTLSGAPTSSHCSVYSCRPASTTPVDSGTNTGAGATVTVTDIAVSNGGFLIVVGEQQASGSGGPFTTSYNGSDTLVMDFASAAAAPLRGAASCLTTQTATTNDPGLTAGAVTKSVAAASWL